jgi:hypothetical protein
MSRPVFKRRVVVAVDPGDMSARAETCRALDPRR